jgi:hypothetical protein
MICLSEKYKTGTLFEVSGRSMEPTLWDGQIVEVMEGYQDGDIVVAEHEERLNLQANPRKTQIFPLKNGVNAYGFKIWTTHRKVRDQSKRAMKRRIKAMDHKVRSGKMNKKDVQQAVNSWLGHARHSNSYSLARRIFRRYKYIRIEGNEYFGNRSNP